MALPLNIEDLLNKRKVESNRIEFKEGWNPDKIKYIIVSVLLPMTLITWVEDISSWVLRSRMVWR